MIDEVARTGETFDAVVLSVGGEERICCHGVVEGLDRNGLSQTPVIAVETDEAASLAKSIEAGRRASSCPLHHQHRHHACARKWSANVRFDLTRDPHDQSAVVSDKAALNACEQVLWPTTASWSNPAYPALTWRWPTTSRCGAGRLQENPDHRLRRRLATA